MTTAPVAGTLAVAFGLCALATPLPAAGAGSAGCPTVAVTDRVPDPVALQRVFDDPNCFSFQEVFPGGFTPGLSP